MESRVSYTLVGAFVVLLAAGLVCFVYWLGAHGDSNEYVHYRVYMSESVSGLSVDASVKYMGVAVGKVEKIMIDPDNSRRVELILRIRRGTPVTVDTTAKLKFFGITGLAFIELEGGESRQPLLPKGREAMPVIPSRPSALKRLDESLSVLASRSEKVLARISVLLSRENMDNFSEFLAELRSITATVRKGLPEVERLANKTSVTEDELVRAARSVREASDRVARMSSVLSSRYDRLGIKVERQVDSAVSSAEDLLVQMKRLVIKIDNLVKHLDESPSDILFRSRSRRSGPGEPGYIPGGLSPVSGSGNVPGR